MAATDTGFKEMLKTYLQTNPVNPKDLPGVIETLRATFGDDASPAAARQSTKVKAKATTALVKPTTPAPTPTKAATTTAQAPVTKAKAKTKVKAKAKAKSVKKAAKKAVKAKKTAAAKEVKKFQEPLKPAPAKGNNAPFTFDTPIATAAIRKASGNAAPMLGVRDPSDPFVPVKKSVHHDYIVCLEDGRRLKMLKRHIRASWGFTPETYRAKWNLPADYPMVAPGYSSEKSNYAKYMGLGSNENKAGKPASVAKISKRAVGAKV